MPSLDPTSSIILPGQLLEDLLVTDLTVEGQGLARYQGRVVFLDRALPGALVRAKVTAVKKRILEAEVVETLQPSVHEIPAKCEHSGKCGACPLQNFSPDASLEWKRRQIRETLARVGKIDRIEVEPVLPCPKEREYRNKMAYAFSGSGDTGVLLGLRQRKSREVFDVHACRMQQSPACDIIDAVRKLVIQFGLLPWRRDGRDEHGYLRFLVIHTPEYRPDGKQQVLVECITSANHDGLTASTASDGQSMRNREALGQLGKALRRSFPALAGVVHSERTQKSDVAQADRLVHADGTASFQEQFGSLVLEVPFNAFLQTNTGAAAALYELVAREARLDGNQTVWDLYAGIGSIGLYLAPHARAVHGLEIQAEAVKAARTNAHRLGFSHCRFEQGTLDQERAGRLPAPDLIVMDPPRSGLEKNAREALLRTTAGRMLYISCDTATQARDLALLAPEWKATRCLSVDMFPDTPHVETLVVLEPNP